MVGGCAGSGLRIAVGAVAGDVGGWPWGTFAVNLTGALLLGYLLTRLQQAAASTVVTIPLLTTGLLGSYTTFSALTSETWQLWSAGRPGTAGGYVVASVSGGVVLALLGIRIAERRP